MHRFVLRGLSVLTFAGLAASAESAAADCRIAGGCVGSVCEGMLEDDVVRILGRPNQTRRDAEYNFSRYQTRGLMIYWRSRLAPQVSSIFVYGEDCKTDRSIGVGSSSFDVIRAYGRGSEEGVEGTSGSLFYPSEGLIFGIRNGRVIEMQVSRPSIQR